MSTANVSQSPLLFSHPRWPSEDALFVFSSVHGRSGVDAPAPGLPLWTQGCCGGVAEGKTRTLGPNAAGPVASLERLDGCLAFPAGWRWC